MSQIEQAEVEAALSEICELVGLDPRMVRNRPSDALPWELLLVFLRSRRRSSAWMSARELRESVYRRGSINRAELAALFAQNEVIFEGLSLLANIILEASSHPDGADAVLRDFVRRNEPLLRRTSGIVTDKMA